MSTVVLEALQISSLAYSILVCFIKAKRSVYAVQTHPTRNGSVFKACSAIWAFCVTPLSYMFKLSHGHIPVKNEDLAVGSRCRQRCGSSKTQGSIRQYAYQNGHMLNGNLPLGVLCMGKIKGSVSCCSECLHQVLIVQVMRL